MTPLAPHITAYLRQRLPVERAASPHTCDTYAYAFQLLFEFASRSSASPPSALQLEHLDARSCLVPRPPAAARGNGPRTRNARLTAIKSFMHFRRASRPGRARADPRVLRHSRPEDRQAAGRPSHRGAVPGHPRRAGSRDPRRASATAPCSTWRHRRLACLRVGRAAPRRRDVRRRATWTCTCAARAARSDSSPSGRRSPTPCEPGSPCAARPGARALSQCPRHAR